MVAARTAKVILAAWTSSAYCFAPAAAEAAPADEAAAFVADDECAAGEDCALNALQLRAQGSNDPSPAGDEENGGDPLFAPADPTWSDVSKMGYGPEFGGDELAPMVGSSAVHSSNTQYCTSHVQEERCGLYKHCRGRMYCVFGNYMVVPGKPCPGMEAINGQNAHQFDYLFGVARGLCGTPGCVLMTNPVGHRTQDQLHIHFRHYNQRGPEMKARLEDAVCTKSGWQSFNTKCCGCGHSKAAAFRGYPRVFSEVANAFGGGSLASVGISVWFGCGKTIVLATTHCSIEHTVSVR